MLLLGNSHDRENAMSGPSPISITAAQHRNQTRKVELKMSHLLDESNDVFNPWWNLNLRRKKTCLDHNLDHCVIYLFFPPFSSPERQSRWAA